GSSYRTGGTIGVRYLMSNSLKPRTFDHTICQARQFRGQYPAIDKSHETEANSGAMERSPEGIVREIPLWRCLFPLRCQNEPLRWNYGALVLASRLLGLGLRPSVPGYLVRHATGD